MREFKASQIQASLICAFVCVLNFQQILIALVYYTRSEMCLAFHQIPLESRSFFTEDFRVRLVLLRSFASPRLPGFSTSWIDRPDETRLVGLTALESTLAKSAKKDAPNYR